MDSNLGPAFVTTLFGVVLLVFHRKLAHRYAAIYQNAPELKTIMLEWCGLLGGAIAVIMGIALLGYPDHRLVNVPILVIGFVSIFLSDWNARRTIVWCQSEKYWRIANLLMGLLFTAIGVLGLAQNH